MFNRCIHKFTTNFISLTRRASVARICAECKKPKVEILEFDRSDRAFLDHMYKEYQKHINGKCPK